MPKPSFHPESQKITPSNASNDWRISNYFNYMFRFVEAWPLNDRGEALPPRGGDHANGSAGDPPGGHACPSPSTPFTLLKKSGELSLRSIQIMRNRTNAKPNQSGMSPMNPEFQQRQRSTWGVYYESSTPSSPKIPKETPVTRVGRHSASWSMSGGFMVNLYDEALFLVMPSLFLGRILKDLHIEKRKSAR